MPHHRFNPASQRTNRSAPPAPRQPRRTSEHTDPGSLHPRTACRLIVTYTRPGDVVADLDASPMVAAAADWLDREFTANPHRYPPAGDPDGSEPRLLFTRLPRPGITDLGEVAEWMRTCRMLLAPGGHLVAVVRLDADEPVNHAATVATAASAARLRAVSPPWRSGADLTGILVFEASHV